MIATEEIKRRIIDAAVSLACTPNDETSGLTDDFRNKIISLIDACEDLVRWNAEIIQWVKIADDMPDDSIDVLVMGKMAASDDNTFVWPGYFDSADDCWRTAHGTELELVTHWADMPRGPVE